MDFVIEKIVQPLKSLGITGKSPWLWLIVSGYLLRISLMPVTGQHDVMFMAWQTHFITTGHTNLYAYLYERFGDVVMNRPAVWAPYPYGFYAFTSLWLTLIERIGLVELTDWNMVWELAHPARIVFLLKLAYLPFDILIGYILYLSGQGRRGRLLWALWAWSPTAIYTPFMMGQNDVYAAAFMTAGLYSAEWAIRFPRSPGRPLGKWALLSVLFLGAGATFKTFPLLLIPVVSLLLTDGWRQRFGLMCLGGSVFGLLTLPFLTTPAFLDGVLLNPEGLQLFRESHLFGYPVPLFFVSYAALLIYLSSKITPTVHNEVWTAGLVSLALIFFFVPTPLYWLIWITPLFVVSVGYKGLRAFVAWVVLQLGFSILLLNQHPELGIALPVHLSDEFNIPNLSTTMSLTQPLIQRGLAHLWLLMNSAIVAALGIVLWYVPSSIREEEGTVQAFCHCKKTPVIVSSVLVMFLGLGLNLYLARNLVSRNNWLEWDQLTVSSENPTVWQTFIPEFVPVTGVRLRILNASDSAACLQACLIRKDGSDERELACSSANISQQVENQSLYFLFDNPLLLELDRVYALRFHLETPGATITFPYSADRSDMQVQSNDTTIAGTMDISILRPFSIRNALKTLVVQNIGRDICLLSLMVITGVISTLLIVRLLRQQHSYEYEPTARTLGWETCDDS